MTTGSSPRVRSRRTLPVWLANQGIISACAEQTRPRQIPDWPPWDHLRVCGADRSNNSLPRSHPGSSPRVRSRPTTPSTTFDESGIISACAEQTAGCSRPAKPSKDHLRVCGADDSLDGPDDEPRGSSPRVRSRLDGLPVAFEHGGIISACAEQTTFVFVNLHATGDHLRVCGADLQCMTIYRALLGSSPRVRSRHHKPRRHHEPRGIISACAEQTVVFYCGLGWSGVAEYLIHALRGVGKRRGCQYLE